MQTSCNAVWSNERQLKYKDRNEVRIKASKMFKSIISVLKSDHFYDFFGQKVIVMTKKTLGQNHFWTKSHRIKSPRMKSPGTKSPKIKAR